MRNGISWWIHRRHIGSTIFCRANAVPLWCTADLIAVSTPPGLLFGRVANFINAELWGRPTEVYWGVIFPVSELSNAKVLTASVLDILLNFMKPVGGYFTFPDFNLLCINRKI